ncbi:hypothetical protein F4810DRAFT_255348 [Camillea tinctor]|nr:hypothetical protein F4810DRAFT_255348 [Camillea tinctor]
MCTGVEWIWRCHSCNAVLMKDHFSVKGYTCHEATRNRMKGLCRKGVKYTHFDKHGGELCLLCEIQPEIDSLSAENCDEAATSPLAVVFDDDEDVEDGGAPLK